MSGLFHTLGIGAESLYASRQGVDTTGHNIANAQVDGYSRQRVNVKQREPSETHGIIIGNGVYAGSVTRLHDQFVENQLNRANQDASAATARHDGLRSIENIFNPELADSIESELSGFFASLQDLANFPEELTTRTNVQEMAQNLCRAFRRVDTALRSEQAGFNEAIRLEAGKLNDQLAAVGKLNVRIRELEAGNESFANDMRDERDKIVNDISNTIDLNYYEDANGMMCLRGPKQISLVEGQNFARVEVQNNADDPTRCGLAITDFEGDSIRLVSDAIEGGKIRGLMELRDQVVPGLIEKNDQMASALVESFNGIHRSGFGLKNYSESVGRNFFDPVAGKNVAQNIKVADVIMESPDAISAGSSPNAPGDTVILNQLIGLKDATIMEGGRATLRDFYGNYIGVLGLDVVRSEHVMQADKILVNDLNSRKQAVSGVSLDEEATNLLRWQACFTASSKVITTVDEMLDTVLGLKR